MDGATGRNSRQPAAARLQNLNLDIRMMQTAQDWNRGDTTDLLRLPKIGRILVQHEMRDSRCKTFTGACGSPMAKSGTKHLRAEEGQPNR
jgi:hypothetical protein